MISLRSMLKLHETTMLTLAQSLRSAHLKIIALEKAIDTSHTTMVYSDSMPTTPKRKDDTMQHTPKDNANEPMAREYKATGYNQSHPLATHVPEERYATVAIPYAMAVRIVNVLEDLHFQMQQEPGSRFLGYPIKEFEQIDTRIRDNMANLALSIETRTLAEKASQND